MSSLNFEHLINLLSDTFMGIITYVDSDLRHRFISGQHASWFGKEKGQIVGEKMEEVLGKENFIRISPQIDKVLEGVDTVFESKLQHKKLGQREVKVHFYPDRDEYDRVTGFLVFIYDFTDQKMAEKLAKDNEAKFFNILMHAPIIFCLMNGPDHVYDLINAPGRSYFGGRDFTGMKVKDAVPEMEGQGLVKMLDELYEKGVSAFFPNKLVKLKQSDGSFKEYYFDLYYEPLKDHGGKTTGILNIAVDVTEKVLSTQRLETAVKLRDEFLTIASHEFRTPLTTLKLQAQLTLKMLAHGMEISQDRQRALANQTSELVSRLNRLLDDMLDVSRIKAGKIRLEKTRVDLGQLLAHVINQMQWRFKEVGIDLPSVHLQEKVEGNWDRIRLEQVMGNLLGNAISYGKGRPIEIDVQELNERVIISVHDQGIGIAKEDQTRIFERFERAISSSEVSGMGLGLFIAREIIEAHGGTIRLESELGKGSSFIVDLPMV